MVVVQATINLADSASLDAFDDIQYMAFGDDSTAPNIEDTQLGNELLRVRVDSSTKNVAASSYTFVGRIPLPRLNGQTVRELGLFAQESGGNLSCRILSPIDVTPGTDEEIIYTLVLKTNTSTS